MRVVIKGGVWKNSEDEILKAAISKYGKNQWARISSLLVRKTPKQCKARWYEWLDPSIKKTEWSKEEDEKLLHLAKLMPTQWRTIAPIVGRTANQCLDRYQKLLDDAEQRDNEDLGLSGTGAEAGPSADDVRRLRPGEVDPDPENKPARPDPIDMDEDEKEMLSEARARLANTQGKKAKRKARERQLEEARRLAMLQKKRELKAAGIQTRFKVKQKGMDYNADIPFEKAPAPGYYDTTEEQNKKAGPPVGKTVRELEGRKKKDAEDTERKKRQKKAKEANAQAQQGGAMANFVPAKEQQIQRLKEEQQISKRRKLVLPGAQVGDQELEEIVKIGQAGEAARLAAAEGGNEAGRGLLGEYSALSHAKDARTPRTAPQADNVVTEARNLRTMSMAQTPLLGDENTPLHELANRGTGFEGATPMHGVAPTPNPLATPYGSRGGSEVGATPRGAPGSMRGPSATPMRTPRDNLAINTPYGAASAGETPREQKMRERAGRSSLEQAFAALPKPKNDFELVVPEDEVDEDEDMQVDGALSVEDAADRDARIAARKAEERAKMLARRTQAVKLNLPRPVEFDPSSLLYDLQSADEGTLEQELERLVAMEMVRLLEHDAIAHPLPGGKIAGGQKSMLERIADADLEQARQAVNVELGSAIGFPGAREDIIKRTLSSQVDITIFDSVWTPISDSLAYDAGSSGFVDKSTLSKKDAAKGQGALLEIFKTRMTSEAAKAAKQEKKLGTVLGGYQARFKTLSAKLASAYEQMDESILALDNFRALANSEDAAIPRRIEVLTKEVRDLERREREGQVKYSELTREKTQLSAQIQELEIEYAEAVNEQAMQEMDES